jgi:hypothetical protein
MYSVEEIICQLLLRHSCVIIPSFGGFVAQSVSASIDKENGIIHPPSKHLLFNKNLINNDGLLTAEFATINHLNYNDSFSQIDLFTGNLKSELNAGRKVELPKIGTFHLDTEKNICFEQNRYFNFLLNAYGLGNVQFVPTPKLQVQVKEKTEISEPTIEIEIPNIAIETPIIELNTPKKSRKIIKYVAAAACFLPIAFYSFWIPVKTDVLNSGVISINDFNPFYKTEKGLYSPNKLDLESIKFEDVNYTATPNSKLESTEIEPTEKVNTSENTSYYSSSLNEKSSSKRQNFEYIVGCFSSNSNAVNLVNTLKNQGFDASIISGGNLTRVSIGSASNTKELDSLIQLSHSKGYQGWILK